MWGRGHLAPHSASHREHVSRYRKVLPRPFPGLARCLADSCRGSNRLLAGKLPGAAHESKAWGACPSVASQESHAIFAADPFEGKNRGFSGFINETSSCAIFSLNPVSRRCLRSPYTPGTTRSGALRAGPSAPEFFKLSVGRDTRDTQRYPSSWRTAAIIPLVDRYSIDVVQ